MEITSVLWEYAVRILPGVGVGAVVLATRPRPIARVGVYVLLFVLLRDAMTPVGLWSLGSEGFFWLRIYPSPLFMILFGIVTLSATFGIYLLDEEQRRLVRWFDGPSPALGGLLGLAAALVVVAPLFVVYRTVPIAERGGQVAASLLLPLAVFALLGNLFEEWLFRGYVLGYLAERRSRLSAGIVSGIVFAFCHVFLATTVTDVGLPLLIFTLWEGVLAGLIGAKFGVIPATVTHGGAVFLLASGLI